MKYWLAAILLIPFIMKGQSPTSDFSGPPAVCVNENIVFGNGSSNADTYEWDFCADDLIAGTAVPSDLALPGFANGFGYQVANDNGMWYGFAVSQGGSKIYRLDFGTQPLNAPTVTDLGNPQNALVFPEDIELYKEGSNWYGFIGMNGNFDAIVKLSFGNSLANTPTATSLGNLDGAPKRFWDLKIVKQNQDLILVAINRNDGSLYRINFRDSFENSIDPLQHVFNTGPIQASQFKPGFDIVRKNNEWLAVLSSYGDNALVYVSFAEDILGPHTVEATHPIPNLNKPYRIRIVREGSTYYGIVSNEASPIALVDLHDLNPANSPDAIAKSNLPTLLGLNLFRYEGNTVVQGVSLADNRFRQLVFGSDCGASITFSRLENPFPVKYESSGEKIVELVAIKTSTSEVAASGKNVTVSTTIAPDIAFSSENVCAGSHVHFTSENFSGNIASYTWDFDDGSPAVNVQHPSHQYSAGIFSPSLSVVSDEGCSNVFRTSLQIYAPPIAQFTMFPGLICTNNPITFLNTTHDAYDGHLLYRWYADGKNISDTRDLITTFLTTGVKTIKLETAIPGCSDEEVQLTSEIKAGPQVDFTLEGNCEGKDIFFRSEISELVSEYTWSFDDGSPNSNLQDPVHIFNADGDYQVSLTALSPNGCNNSHAETVTIDAAPQPAFAIESQPSSCSGSPTAFSDLTPPLSNGSIISWQWTFGDGESAIDQNPFHTFQSAGEYSVELVVTTEFGCIERIESPVTILQSPILDFAMTSACVGKMVNFSATSDDAVQYYWEIGTSYYETQSTSHAFNTTGVHTVKVSVVGSNECISSLIRELVVPQPVDPVFTATNNCKDLETRFTSTSSGADPVVTRNWNFSGEGTSAEANPSFAFHSVGNKIVTLQVTTASGCVYQRQSLITVVEAPVADFTFSPGFGVPPQEISFLNASSNATSFDWNFGDGGASKEMSPKHTFTELGDYDVRLVAANNAGCENSVTKVISMVAPLPDVDLNLMTITSNGDGTSKVIVTIANKGNTFVRNLPVRLDISGNVTLETLVKESIAPFSMYNLVLDFGIAQTQSLEFLCASTFLEGDLHPEGNRICNQLRSEVAILSPYPNPTTDLLSIEWVAQENEAVNVKLVDTDGKTIVDFTELSVTGLNLKTLDLTRLRAGIYILRISTPSRTKTHRILVSH